MKTDIIIIGSGVAGLYAALNLPKDKNILILTKRSAEESDSFLAQGGICTLKDSSDYDLFFEDTMRAGHYENNPKSVEIMINSSGEVIKDLVGFGVEFNKNSKGFVYTKEGAHSANRILFNKDETGKEITSKLLMQVKARKNITLIENFTVVDLIVNENTCMGVIGQNKNKEYAVFNADYTILATGGIGGLFKHSTNYSHLTGDALALALKYNIKLEHINYIQIHPTTLYTKNKNRAFLISESVRGEGAVLLNAKGQRFVNELLPRDEVAKAIFEQMKRDKTDYVMLSFEAIPKAEIKSHFPNIYNRCLEEGYDITREPIPVVPAQHYLMGGIAVDSFSKTSMQRLYASGETACNGVHGKNRLASNSLLESLVFAKRAAEDIAKNYSPLKIKSEALVNKEEYKNCQSEYKKMVLQAIERENNNE